MAETTATTALFRDASARIFATRLMQAASPTDVPPNFITCKGLFIFSRIRRNSIGKWLENRPSASKGASKNYTLLQRFYAHSYGRCSISRSDQYSFRYSATSLRWQ